MQTRLLDRDVLAEDAGDGTGECDDDDDDFGVGGPSITDSYQELHEASECVQHTC